MAITKRDWYSSSIHSILKCQYGWPAMLPDNMTWDEWDLIISNGYENHCPEHAIAERLAQEFAKRGGKFSERADGKPNTRSPKQTESDKHFFNAMEELLNEGKL